MTLEAPMDGLTKRIASLSPAKRALLDLRLKKHGAGVPGEAISRRTNRGSAPLSFAQQRLWFLNQLEPGSSTYNVPRAIRLRGVLNVEALKQTLNEIVRRHEALRTSFVAVDGQPVQVIAESGFVTLPITDLGHLPDSQRYPEAMRLGAEEAKRSFDLAQGPLFRASLLRLGEDDHILLLSLHHIVSDAWSAAILFRELGLLYEGYCKAEQSHLPDLDIQYADYAVWQSQRLQGSLLDSQLSYWRQQLAGAPVVLQLPTDRPRPAVQSFRGANQSLVVPKEISEELKRLSQREGVTLYMSLLAAYQVLLGSYSGQEDIVVGTPVVNRDRVETEGVIGLFLNTVVMRGRLGGDPEFVEVMRRVKEAALGAYEHQELPFEKLVEELHPERSLSHTPLFQAMFFLQDPLWRGLELSNLTLNWLDLDSETSKLDLTLAVVEEAEGLTCWLEYSTDLFDAATISRMLGHFQTLLEAIVADPHQRLSELSLPAAAERHQLLVEWNNTHTDYTNDQCIHELFEQQVARTPDAVAVVFENQRFTYEEINRRANRLAHYLKKRAVGPEVLVGICVERSVEMVVGLLGILKAGGAYVPLDPSYPRERLSFMLDDAGVRVLLTQERLVGKLPEHEAEVVSLDGDWDETRRESEDNPVSRASADNLAYVIYTSGSTGRPKGVMGLHRASLNRFWWMWKRFPFEREEVCCQKTSLSFVDSIWEIFGPLLRGVQVVIISDEAVKDPYSLVETLADKRVTRIVLVPSLLRAMLDSSIDLQNRLPKLKYWVVSGEALSKELSQHFMESMPDSILINLYGSSEVAADVTWYDTRDGQTLGCVPIGRPIANTEAYILNSYLRPVPIGVPGELYIGGDSLARGYLNRPDLTAERFVPDPFSDSQSARLYKTGDLARHLPSGEIEYLGRVDHQVKIRGFRIELGEVEAVLTEHPSVGESVVIAREDGLGEKRLIGYVARVRKPAPTVSELRGYLGTRLPEYMVPGAYVIMEELPLTPNGKVDRSRLPEPDQSRPETEERYVEARTEAEELLAGIWREVLALERVGIYDNFFELGGHSLLVTQVMSRVRDAFQVELPLRCLFESPTVAALSERIETARGSELQAPPLVPVSRDGQLPLSFAQQRLWFLDQLEPANPSYNIRRAIRMRGALNVEALQHALDTIVARHESLRASFVAVDGKPTPVIAEHESVGLPVIELSHLPENEREPQALRLAAAEAQRPFDLTRAPLLRASLLRLNECDYMFLLTMHHIVSDAWSMGIFFQELATLYEAFTKGEPSPLPALNLQYADYALWQREWLQGSVLESQLSYWKEQLAGLPAVLDLPTDRPRPQMRNFRGAKQKLVVPTEISEQLKRLSQREGVTLYMSLLAAFQVLLWSYSGQEEIVVGTPVANRNRVETEAIIGLFLNTVVLRGRLGGDPEFVEVMRRVRATALGAYEHQEMPFEKLVDELQLKRNLSYNPLFQVWFVLQNALRQPLELPDLTLTWLDLNIGMARHDLQLTLWETPDGLRGSFEYNTDLFDAATISRVAAQFESLLGEVVAQPLARLSVLKEGLDQADRRHQIIREKQLQEGVLSKLKSVRRKAVSGPQLMEGD